MSAFNMIRCNRGMGKDEPEDNKYPTRSPSYAIQMPVHNFYAFRFCLESELLMTCLAAT